MNRSPGPDALLAVHDEQDAVGVGELALDPALHALGERSRADAGRPAGRRAPSASPPSTSVAMPRTARRVVCGRSEMIATFGADDRVDQRRLADVGPTRKADEARAGVTGARP